jgi:chaperonin cofactor prefoldin
MATKKEAKSPVSDKDWGLIEADYRAGIKTLRQMASEHGITEGAIRKRAKREDWERDLEAKIREKADALVRNEAVRSEVREQNRVPEKDIVEANAVLQATIRREQRKDIQRSRKLVMSLLDELEEQTDNRELYKQLGELMFKPDDKGVDKLNELYQKVISLGGRTSTMKSLAESLKTLVGLEREAFGIDDKNGPGTENPLAQVLEQIASSPNSRLQVK